MKLHEQGEVFFHLLDDVFSQEEEEPCLPEEDFIDLKKEYERMKGLYQNPNSKEKWLDLFVDLLNTSEYFHDLIVFCSDHTDEDLICLCLDRVVSAQLEPLTASEVRLFSFLIKHTDRNVTYARLSVKKKKEDYPFDRPWWTQAAEQRAKQQDAEKDH